MDKVKHLVLFLALVAGIGLAANVAFAVPPAVQAKSEFMLADKLFNERKLMQAIEHAEKARSILGKTNSRIEYLLAYAYFDAARYEVVNIQVDRYGKAKSALDAFFKVTPESESSSKQYTEMVALYAQVEGMVERVRKMLAVSKKTLNIEMVPVSGGCFQMGRKSFSDGPVHEACVDGFQIGKYEVTAGQWLAVMGIYEDFFWKDEYYPAEHMSWNDVQKFISILNSKTGRNYRLATEAEWEYACRSGGKQERYCGGDDCDALAWYKGNSADQVHPVGTKKPNGLGIYDMSGNSSEWCQDWSDHVVSGGVDAEPWYYKGSPRENPKGPASGKERVIRGGYYLSGDQSLMSGYRASEDPNNNPHYMGFRLVLTQEK